jgi:hypothetical protein
MMINTRADQILLDDEVDGSLIHVRALSPSNASVNNSLVEIAKLTATKSTPENDIRRARRLLPSPTQNHNAIAIWVQLGTCAALLGSDLEETSSTYTGWSVIVDSATRPRDRAQIFKIPHHGSKTAYSDEVWEEMIIEDAAALMTQFSRSNIPTTEDVERLRSKTQKLFMTTTPSGKRPRRSNVVERLYRASIEQRQTLGKVPGQLQARVRPDSGVSVRGQPPAIRL